MPAVATFSTMSEHFQQHHPFMRLPIELRLMIYEFALEEILQSIDDAIKARMNPGTPKYIGALALLHTNRTLHDECIYALGPLVLAHRDALRDGAYQQLLAIGVAIHKGLLDHRYESETPRDMHKKRRFMELGVDKMQNANIMVKRSARWLPKHEGESVFQWRK